MVSRRIPALSALRAFEALARHGTLSKAADELCVTASAIGHQVRGLEQSLAARLFVSNGRTRSLTREGEILAASLSQAFDQIETACRVVSAVQRPTELHINVTPTFAIRWLVPRLGRFQARHPEIAVHIMTSAKPVDLECEKVHAGLRFGKPPWPGLAYELVFMEDVFPVCHPALMEGPHGLSKPEALKHHTLLHTFYRSDDWAHWLDATGVRRSIVDPTRGLTFDLTTMAIDAAEAGLGVAITREAQVTDALDKGDLVAPFRRDLLRGEGCYFLSRRELWDAPHIAAFRAWLLEEAAAAALPASTTALTRRQVAPTV